ncbi:MAG: T9SS type A sorting domain-containing protein, partial [Bacteroidota bacterium]
LMADSIACLSPDATVSLMAVEGMAPTLPEGYAQVYVLTQDSSLTVSAVDTFPIFEVGTPGLYTIHSFVYDPSELVLPELSDSVVVTGFDLLAQIEADSLCASLDVAGAPFMVEACELSCKADAPSMSALKQDLCLNSGVSELQAFPQTFPEIENGFTQVFVLTSGEEEIVQKVSEWPLFQVDQPGTYKVYAFVYNSRDIFLGLIEFGQLSIQDLMEFVADIDPCAAFSPEGAFFKVEDCDCPVDPGLLTAEQIGCFDGINPVRLNLGLKELPVVPRGFSLGYVLAKGQSKIIQGAYRWPFIGVSDTGVYSVHPLVYNPQTFNLNSLESGLPASPDREDDDDDEEGDDDDDDEDDDDDDDENQDTPTRLTVSLLSSYFARENICARIEENGAEWTIEGCIDFITEKAEFNTADSRVANTGDLDGASFHLSPNPSYGFAYIQGIQVQRGTHELLVIDMQGKVVKKGNVSSFGEPYALDLQDLSNGFYGVQVVEPSGRIHSFKLSLQR